MCPTCYKRIPAVIRIVSGKAIMFKDCPAHGPFKAIVDPDGPMVLRQYNQGSLGINKAILVPVTDKCNMKCSWCYTKGVEIPELPAEHYDLNYFDLKQNGFTLLLSGGEPTCRPDFVEFVNRLRRSGWPVVTMSNMIAYADEGLMREQALIYGNTLCADFSMQHPKNYSGEDAAAKFQALANLEKLGLKANCIQFSISSLDEIEWIRSFYNDTKQLYHNLRIRTLHGFWKDKSKKIYLSDLHREFMVHFADLMPMTDCRIETTNIYSIYMRDLHCGISLSSAPTIKNVDLQSCKRPTYGVALDGKYYGFPVAQLISEGIQKGWYNGFKICEEK